MPALLRTELLQKQKSGFEPFPTTLKTQYSFRFFARAKAMTHKLIYYP